MEIQSSEAKALHSQFTEDWDYWMKQYAEVATALGYPGQNTRWTDYSQAAIEGRADYLKRSAGRLLAINREQLQPNDQINYDLYRDLLETAVQGLEFQNDALPIKGVIPHNLRMPVNQMEGVQQDIPRVIAIMPRQTAEDYENILARLERVGQLIEQTIELMQQGLSVRMTPPQITLRDLPAQLSGQIFDDPMKSPLLEAFRRMPRSISQSDGRQLQYRAEQAYRAVVVPAFSNFHNFLTSRYLPACRTSTDVASLPGGGAMYKYNVRWHTTTDVTPREIHDVGHSEVQRIRSEMDQIIAAAGFQNRYDEFKSFLRTDSRFYFSDTASFLTAYRDIAKRADPELARLFAHLPQTPYGVKSVPEAVASSQTTAYYDPGSLKAGRAGYMFVNAYKLEARPKWEMEALTMHEAVPGHHLQISIAQELEGLPEFRKNSSYTAFVEGWGLYAEFLGSEMDFYKDPFSRFGQLTYEMWRAIRLVVDTGLHFLGWTRDEAIDYFRQNAAKTDQDIIVEVDRYIVWPGQAVGYKMGELKIKELRARAEQRLGARFDIRAFHDVVLRQGAVPLDMLEQQVNAWAETV